MLLKNSKLIRLDNSVLMPRRQTLYSIGYDLHANQNINISPNCRAKIHTGIKLNLYKNDETGDVHYALIQGRSGLSIKGIDIILGLIDPDYSEELLVNLVNNTSQLFKVLKGDRIAQLIIIEYNLFKQGLYDENNCYIKPKNALRVSGFGSTGVF